MGADNIQYYQKLDTYVKLRAERSRWLEDRTFVHTSVVDPAASLLLDVGGACHRVGCATLCAAGGP